MRTVAEIDRDIDAIHNDLKSRYPALRRVAKRHYGPTYLAACMRWQAAWDAHPDLHEQERKLFLERHAARQAEYDAEAAQAHRAEVAERRAAVKLTKERKTAVHRTVAEILADPETPAWIKESIKRLRKSDPIYLAFIEALHDMRIAVPVYAREG
jgi:hypothetical protein